jgi:hypothetical protein
MAKAKDVKTLKTNYRKIMENAKRWQLRVQDLKNLREEYKAMKHQLPDYGKRNTWSSRFGIGDIGSASEYNRRMARWHAQQGNPMQPNFTPSQMIEYQKFKGRKQYNEKEKPYIERTEATLKTLQEQYEKFKDKTTPRASNVARQIAQKETDLRRARRI